MTTPFQRLQRTARRLPTNLGAPGLMIGTFSVLSLVLGVFVLVVEYDRPGQSARKALHRVLRQWVRAPDYLGRTLVDYADAWREAPEADRPARLRTLSDALERLGGELDRQSERFPSVHVLSMELTTPGRPALARWRSASAAQPSETEVVDRLPIPEPEDGDVNGEVERPAPGVEVALAVRYHVSRALESAAHGVETSYRRLLFALLGLSTFSLLCLGYMVFHAQSLSERAAREAAQQATLDLADRACHELGNGVFVLSNERRNLAVVLDLVERFVDEAPAARDAAARRAGLEPDLAGRWDSALRHEYGSRGIDPERDLRGVASLARHVCRQIDLGTEYIRLTVHELDRFLKRSALPVSLEPVPVADCFDDALTLLRPRLDAAEVKVVRDLPERPPVALADRRLLTHALVNLIKNAVEAVAAAGDDAPAITLSARVGPGDETVTLTVADNGPGIPPAVARRVFEDGYTTKGDGRGRGLAIARESIATQEGRLSHEPRPGGGAEFHITLAAAHDPGRNGAAAHP